MLTRYRVAEVIRLLYVLPMVTAFTLMATLGMSASPTVIAFPLAQEPTPTLDFESAQTEANSLMQEGNMLRSRSEFGGALEHFQRALSIYGAIGDRAGKVYALIAIGSVHQTLGDYDKALECYQKSWPEGESRTLAGIGAIYAERGEYQQAFRYIQEALNISRATKNHSGESAALISLGVVYQRLGEYTVALKYFQDALQIGQEIKHPVREANALNGIGSTYGHLGDYQEALECLLKALDIRRAIPDRVGEANTLNNIGVIYLYLGDYSKAIESFLQSVTVSKMVSYRVGEVGGLNSVAVILQRLGKNRESLEYSLRALRAVREIDRPMGEATILTNIGYSYYKLGEYAKAFENCQQALSMHIAIGYRVGEAATLGNIGGIYSDLGNPQKAVEYYQQALSINRTIGYARGEFDQLFNIGYLYEKQRDYRQAFDNYSQAIDVIEELRGELTAEELRATLAASEVVVVYEHTILTLLKLNRPVDAFNYSERAKARTFLDLLGNQRMNSKASEDSQLIGQVEKLLGEISALDRRLRQELAKPIDERVPQELENLNSILEAKKKEYQDLRTPLGVTSPEYAEIKGTRPPLKLKDAQALLRKEALHVTLLVYFVGEEETAIFVVSPNTFHAHTVSVTRADLWRQADELLNWRMKVGSILPNAWQSPARALYEWLIESVKDYLPSVTPGHPRHLGIVPHGLLHYLPFSLLYDGKKTLLDDYNLFYAPSVSSLEFIFEKRHAQADTLLAFANPDVPGESYLHHAVEEAETVAALYEAQPLIGSDATESRFKAQAGEYNLVHIAAHSDYKPHSPLLSAILLSKGNGEDGRLNTYEILNLDLPQTDLVVLSACETHLGELSAGDELVGLERAFIRAGSPSLLTTLWPVDDAPTAELMKRFYTYLRAGVPKAEALRLAQLETRAEYPEPYYWAGFVLVGDVGLPSEVTLVPESTPTKITPALQPTPTKSRRSGGLCSGAAVLLVMTALASGLWHRHRRRVTILTNVKSE